jgi:ABC-2 type transport system permease protein
MIQPRLAWAVARKDLLLFLADRRGVLLCFGVPILLASAFGAVFHRPDGGPAARPAVWVVCHDTGPFARRVRDALCGSDKVEASACDLAAARRRLAAESSGVVVVLPAGFGGVRKDTTPHPQLLSPGGHNGALPCVQILHAPGAQLEGRWVEGVLTEVVFRETARAWLGPRARLERPFTVRRSSVAGAGALAGSAYSHSFCGMTLQYLLFWGVDSGVLLLRERRAGLWRRLRAAPLGAADLLAGRALATAVVALAQVLVVFAFGFVVFGVRVTGSPAGFVLMAVAAAGLSASTGLLVAALGGNETRARSVAILVILTLSLLGGLWLPAFLLPPWARTLALALPTTWADRGLEGAVWQGAPFGRVWPCALALAGFSALFLLVAWGRLARAERAPSPS